MVALPGLDAVDFDEHGKSAWRLLLQAESTAIPSSGKYNDKLIGVRLVGFFLKDFWDLGGQHQFARIAYNHLLTEIFSCNGEQDKNSVSGKICQLGIHYRNHLFRVFRSNSSPTPHSSRHVSRPSFENHKKSVLDAMATAPKTKQDAKKRALFRDGFKCVLSGFYDHRTCADYPEIKSMRDNLQTSSLFTQVAHLFSESAQDSSQDHATTPFAFLALFGLEETVRNLLDGQINSLRNVLTMSAQLLTAFDELRFWLEEVPGSPNTYNVVSPDDEIFKMVIKPRRRVTFEVSPDVVADCQRTGVTLPELPDPSLIAIRSACARVAHMSGAAEQMDSILRDMEDVTVMADDGSHADLLSSLLYNQVSVLDSRA